MLVEERFSLASLVILDCPINVGRSSCGRPRLGLYRGLKYNTTQMIQSYIGRLLAQFGPIRRHRTPKVRTAHAVPVWELKGGYDPVKRTSRASGLE